MPATSTLLARAAGQWSSRASCALRASLPTTAATRIRTPALSALARYYASYPPHHVITMPALSPTMTAGNIGAWQKKVGDSISPGDVLVEIETDKAQMDFEFQEEGTIAAILRDAGAKDIAVGSVSPAPRPSLPRPRH